jgi:formylglycine-generating enzyme required for sulfatase activity
MQIVAPTGVVVDLIRVPAGDFRMGSENYLFSEAPAHPVKLSTGFLLGKFPVTQSQWQAVMGHNPSTFHGLPNHPVETVTWDQAADFCERLGAHCGHPLRLPSEAEWEYACRAGTTDDFFFEPAGPFLDNSEIPSQLRQTLCHYAWFDLNGSGRTHAVGGKRPNPWRVHDMIGNVWEWCADVWHDDYHGAPQDGRPWLDGHEHQPRRCVRGGAWDMDAFRCRSAYRSFDHRLMATSRLGFRLAMDAD